MTALPEATARDHIALCPLDHIVPWRCRMRPVDPLLVASLRRNIAEVGLIEPLVVDEDFSLIAGHHRHQAILDLKEADHEAFTRWFPDEQVIVSVQQFRADDHVETALNVMISENFHRREPTREDVLACRQQLQAVGLHVGPGGPKDEPSSTERLCRMFNKTHRQMRRLLSREEERPKKPCLASPVSTEIRPPTEQVVIVPSAERPAVTPAEPQSAEEPKGWHREKKTRMERAQNAVECLNDAEYVQFCDWQQTTHAATRQPIQPTLEGA